MTLKKNTLINYISRGYLGLVGILVSPILIHMLGSESFGLIAVFSLIQTWLQLLDLGLSNTLTRESAKYQAGAYKKNDFNNLIKYVKFFYLIIFFIIMIAGFLFSEAIAVRWLNTKELVISDVMLYTYIMIFCISIRWLSVPFRSVLVGLSAHKSLAKIDMVMATYRSPICVVFLYVFGGELFSYFLIQLSHSIIVLVWLYISSAKYIKLENEKNNTSCKVEEELDYKKVVVFTLQMLLTTVVWLIVSQFDKLYLSKVSLLSEYGMFTIAVQLSSIIMILSSPFSVALLPKLVQLKEKKDTSEYENVYITSFHFLMSILIPVCCVITFFSYEILLLWTQSTEIAIYGNVIVKLYVIGNLLLAISGFAYYILFSNGNLKPHVYMSIISAAIIIPAYILVINRYGAVGSAVVWVAYNFILILVWIPYVQIKQSSLKVTFEFYLSLLKITSVSFSIVALIKWLNIDCGNIGLLVLLSFTMLIASAFSMFTSRSIRYFGKEFYLKSILNKLQP